MATNNSINANAVTPLASLYGGTGVANASTITVGGNTAFSGAFTFTGTVTGNTAVTFPTSGTLSTTSQIILWNSISGTTQAAAVNNAYVVDNVALTTVTLPATAAQGSIVILQGKGAGGWVLTANTGQTIKLGSSTTSSAGSLASTNLYDCIEVVCITANTTWAARSSVSSGLTVT